MLQIRTNVFAGLYGSMKAVVGSGTTSMSLSWISWKPRIDEPSNPTPSSRAPALAAARWDGKMLPHPRQVGEPQIDHLDLLVLDRLNEIFGRRTIWNHGITPVVE